MLTALPLASRILAFLTALAPLVWTSPVFAQSVGPSGPGQAVPMPPAQCPETISCQYGERNYLPDGYRFQMLEVCGANCTTQYWVSNISDGQMLLTIEPVRGGAIIAVGQGAVADDPHPSVRTLVPTYALTDPACCPSEYQDTTYSWDRVSNALVAESTASIPSADFPGWETARQNLQNEQFFPVFPQT